MYTDCNDVLNTGMVIVVTNPSPCKNMEHKYVHVLVLTNIDSLEMKLFVTFEKRKWFVFVSGAAF